MSAFGGVIAVNGEVSVAMAERLAHVFTEVIVAPEFDPWTRFEMLFVGKNVGLLLLRLAAGGLGCRVAPDHRRSAHPGTRRPAGRSRGRSDRLDPRQWGSGRRRRAWSDLVFAWRACRWIKSNAILLAAGRRLGRIGMGQVNRVDSARLAVSRAGDRAAGLVAASDAFFPFPDGLEVLIGAGVRAVVQPGGSLRDDLVVGGAAKAAGLTMYLTGTRHFAH